MVKELIRNTSLILPICVLISLWGSRIMEVDNQGTAKDSINQPPIRRNSNNYIPQALEAIDAIPTANDDQIDNVPGFVYQFERKPKVTYNWQQYSEPLSQNRESHGYFAQDAQERMIDSNKNIPNPEYAARRSTLLGFTFDLFIWNATLNLPHKNYFILQQIHQDFKTFLEIRAIAMIKTFLHIGYTREGCLRKADNIGGTFSDHLYFGILREEFFKKNHLNLIIEN